MKNLVRLEELAMLCASIGLFSIVDIAWWWYAVLFFTPDIAILGYLINTKVGAAAYNLTHHKAIAVAIVFIGVIVSDYMSVVVGLVMFGHASFDRMIGFGLKYSDDFKHTNLGWIGERA